MKTYLITVVKAGTNDVLGQFDRKGASALEAVEDLCANAIFKATRKRWVLEGKDPWIQSAVEIPEAGTQKLAYDWIVKVHAHNGLHKALRVYVGALHARDALFEAMRDPAVARAIEIDGRDVEIVRA